MFAVLLMTGLVWLALHFLDDGSEGGTLALAWSMKLHGAAAKSHIKKCMADSAASAPK